jgi:hypothetical protein
VEGEHVTTRTIPYFEASGARLVNSTPAEIAAAVALGWLPGFEYSTGPITDADLLLPVLFSDKELRDKIAAAGGPIYDAGMTSAQLAIALLRVAGKTAYDRVEVSSVTANTGTTAGGDARTIAGFGFSFGRGGTPTVTFGGNPATSIVVVSDTSITCVTPAHGAGAVSVIVGNANGSHTKASAFTYS